MNKNSKKILFAVPKIVLFLVLSMFWSTPTSAHSSPAGCTGSGLGINLFSSLTQVNIGDTISYSVTVFNGSSTGPVVCDATGIVASIVTPDGVNHPITLTRTALSNGEADTYLNVVTYTARAVDINMTNGTLAATASDTGVIHQNVTDSQGGGNQGLNVFVLNTLHVIKQVVNTNGGTATAASFNVHVKNDGVDEAGSPALGTGAPGTLYSLIAGTYTVSEDANAQYTATFSGDCDATGNVTVVAGDNKTCTITNQDVAPTANLHFLVRVCPSWSVLAGNARAGNVDATGGHFPEFTNFSPTPPNFPDPYSPKPINPAEIVESCVPKSNWNFTLSTDEAQTLNVSTAGPTDAGGQVTVPFTDLTAAQQLALTSGNRLWVSENPQAGFLFAALRCHNDSANGDNKEFISFGGGPIPADTYCIAYLVSQTGTINVVKLVVNDNGGTKTIFDFPLFVNGTPVVSGEVNTFPANVSYTVTETSDPGYTTTFSGDCDANGLLSILPGDNKVCTVTNDDIAPGGGDQTPPIIDVVKVPSPLSLSAAGLVTYTYTVRNIGTVPMTGVTMVDDSCSPVTFVSGDTNSNAVLDLTETWTYTCSATVSATLTNTVVATGFANDISAIDTASVTVVVSSGGGGGSSGGGGGGSSGGSGPGFPDTGTVAVPVPGSPDTGTVAVPVPGFPDTGAPALPATGFPDKEKNAPWSVVILGLLLLASTTILVIKKRTT